MKYCIFGAGVWGMRFYAEFGNQYDIACFCDNDISKQGKKYLGLPVIAPEAIRELGLHVIIACKQHFDIAQQLFWLGIKEFYLLHPDTLKEVNYIDLTSYNDLIPNPMRICVVETIGTGGNARALLKYNPFTDIDIVLIELGIYDSLDIYINGSNYYSYFTSELFITQNLYDVHGKKCIELWHGFPIKALCYASNDKLAQSHGEYASEMLNNKRDFICSYSKLYNILFGCCMGAAPGKFRITGMPRNDLILRSDAKKQMCKLLGSIKQNRVILYAPTFRESFAYGYDSVKEGYFYTWPDYIAEDFNDFLNEHNTLLLIKVHKSEINDICISELENIRLLSDDMLSYSNVLLYEILGATDILITDYSSIAIDYLLLDKPIIYTIRDVEEYSAKHGLMTEPFDIWAPGETVQDCEGLKSAIHNALFGEDQFINKRNQMLQIMHKHHDAQSSRRVLNLARSVM